MTRTPMNCLQWLFRTRFWVLNKFFQKLKKTYTQEYFKNVSYFVMKMYILCTQRTYLIEDWKDI